MGIKSLCAGKGETLSPRGTTRSGYSNAQAFSRVVFEPGGFVVRRSRWLPLSLSDTKRLCLAVRHWQGEKQRESCKARHCRHAVIAAPLATGSAATLIFNGLHMDTGRKCDIFRGIQPVCEGGPPVRLSSF